MDIEALLFPLVGRFEPLPHPSKAMHKFNDLQLIEMRQLTPNKTNILYNTYPIIYIVSS